MSRLLSIMMLISVFLILYTSNVVGTNAATSRNLGNPLVYGLFSTHLVVLLPGLKYLLHLGNPIHRIAVSWDHLSLYLLIDY